MPTAIRAGSGILRRRSRCQLLSKRPNILASTTKCSDNNVKRNQVNTVTLFGDAKLQRDTKEIEALISALNRSAERLQTLWFTFLGLTLYFVITALTTTHRMLLIEENLSLPLINIKVPLLPFYTIAPLIYIILHFYMLMMMVLLARSSKVFEEALFSSLPLDSEREQFRMRAENALFLQLLIGAKEEREGSNSLMLSAVAVITLAIVPVLTLVIIQMQFLPYHHHAITWLHRVTVGVDAVLVLFLWRGYRFRGGRALPPISWKDWRNAWSGEWLRQGRPVIGLAATFWLSLWEGRWAGEPWVDPVSKEHPRLLFGNGVFFDRLHLPGETVVGAAMLAQKLEEAKSGSDRVVSTRSFAFRNFSYAYFYSVDMRGSSFFLANLQGADLSSAQLQGSIFAGAQLQGADLSRAQLQGADLAGAQLQGATLAGARLHAAVLTTASLKLANLAAAELQGADLRGAEMQGADLSWAEIQGADLRGAQMKGVLLKNIYAFRTILPKTGMIEAAKISNVKITKTRAPIGREPEPPLRDDDVDRWTRAILQSPVDAAVPTFITSLLARLKGDETDEDLLNANAWRALEQANGEADPDGIVNTTARLELIAEIVCSNGLSSIDFPRNFASTNPSIPSMAAVSFKNIISHRRRSGHKCPSGDIFSIDDQIKIRDMLLRDIK
jgi:uncharacterized protein YjbI with pentapeptide repeats